MARILYRLVVRGVTLVALASSSFAGEVTVDPSTGLWFPPYASRDVYLRGIDRAHPYGPDVHKAFAADPKLAAEVCAAVDAWKPAGAETMDISVKQKKTMLAMMCVAQGWQHSEDARDEKARQRLAEAFDEAEKRGPLTRSEYELTSPKSLSALPDDERRIAAIRGVLAHVPSSSMAIRTLFDVGAGEVSTVKVSHRLLIEQIAKRADDPNAPYEWLSPYRYALFFAGDYAGARKVMERIFSGPYAQSGEYDPLFLALLDRMDGKPESFARRVEECPKPSDEEVAALYGYDEPEIHCRSWLEYLVTTAASVLGVEPHPVWRDIIRENAASRYPIVAVNAAHDELAFDIEGARRNDERILAMPRTEVARGVRADALLGIARIARLEKNHERFVELADCWPSWRWLTSSPMTAGCA